MGQSMELTGMVLTAMPVGEYDKRITILTKERGRITAFARGARRPNSQMLAATNPFTFGLFEVFEGKTAYNVARVSVQNYFRELAMDLDAVSLGFYFLEFAEYYCQENNDEREMLKLLYQSLRALESDAIDNRLVRVVFELKAIAINGEGPQVFSCIQCRRQEDLIGFSVKRGGCFCSRCMENAHARNILEGTLYTMQYIISTSVAKLYTFAVTEEVLLQLQKIMKAYMAQYVHHEFKSLGILQEEMVL